MSPEAHRGIGGIIEYEEGSMKIQEVDAELERLFPGEYRSVSYRLSTYAHAAGETATECGVYVHNHGWHTAPTFRGALDLLTGKTEEEQEIAA